MTNGKMKIKNNLQKSTPTSWCLAEISKIESFKITFKV